MARQSMHRCSNFCLALSYLLVLVTLGSACSPKEESQDAPFSRAVNSVVAPSATSDRSVQVDIALDATTSMEGYAHQGSEYGRFLDGLESALGAKWKNADVRFFRFGSRVDSINREVFRSARTDLDFYRVRGLFERTNIDSVLARSAPGRVTVIVTDLFQNDDDKNSLVGQIKTQAFAKGLAAGIIPVESAFNGKIYDAPGGSYTYASTAGDPSTYRPFYALLIGEPSTLIRFMETIQSVAGVKGSRLLLVSPFVVKNYRVSLNKPPETKGINLSDTTGNRYRFNILPESSGGRITGKLSYEPLGLAAPIAANRLVLKTYRASGVDSVSSDEIRMSNPRADDAGAIHFDLEINITQPKGAYSYLLVFETAEIDGQNIPSWVSDLSSPNPTATADPNRTLNLDRFVIDLVQASATLHTPRVGAQVVDIQKR